MTLDLNQDLDLDLNPDVDLNLDLDLDLHPDLGLDLDLKSAQRGLAVRAPSGLPRAPFIATGLRPRAQPSSKHKHKNR